MKKLLLISIMYSLMMLGEAKASDDVYVDLSVLDNIPQDSIGFVSSEPLFPQVKKNSKPVVAKRKAKVVKKTAVKTAKKTSSVKPIVVKKEEVKIEPEEQKVVLPVEEKDSSVAKPKNLLPESVTVNSVPQSDSVHVVENAPTEKSLVSEGESNKMDFSENKAEEQVQSMRTVQPVKPEETINPFKPQDETVSSLENREQENTVLSAQISDKTREDNNVLRPKEIYSLSFEPDSSELTQESQQKLEKIIQLFDAEHKKKISIKAYNYDDGVEPFRKKRVSLNRATEVRSFFLNNGFKNFSIKIINTTVDNDYKDTVEIEELD